jgi:hypothetical protein
MQSKKHRTKMIQLPFRQKVIKSFWCDAFWTACTLGLLGIFDGKAKKTPNCIGLKKDC